MPILKAPNRVVPELVPITPMELMLQQVKGNYDSIRYQAKGMDYIPAQMGGIFGQLAVQQDMAILELIDFEVT